VLLHRVERHLRRFDVPPARFGTEALGDPRFVFDLRRGREPRARTVARVETYIAEIEAELDQRPGRREKINSPLA
jgi:hypothetical protein